MNEINVMNENFKTITMQLIQANERGTRSIAVTEQHFLTLQKYSLLRNLVDSSGFIDDGVLERLQLNLRSLLESAPKEEQKDLMSLAFDVIYNLNMKAFGLHQLLLAYVEWESNQTNVAND